jgi:site-specific DNA-cytosine methylase
MNSIFQDNSEKIILDLCGGTGAWSLPYKQNGYDVRIITKPHSDVFTYEDYKNEVSKIYGILAAPDCTQFSFARTTAKTPRDLQSGFALVQRCLEIIWFCRLNGKLKFWALENPLGILRQFLGKPALVFDPCDYGDNYTKKTDLWGYFNAPKMKPRQLSETEKLFSKTNGRHLSAIGLPKDYVLPDDFTTRKAKRSMTSKNFAEAFYKANK